MTVRKQGWNLQTKDLLCAKNIVEKPNLHDSIRNIKMIRMDIKIEGQ